MNFLVAIKSCNRYADRRNAVRRTWLPSLDWSDHVFIIGRPQPQKIDDDVLYCEVSDDFPNIAPKIYCVCLYALERDVDFMFVCDDDTYVRPERLIAAFTNYPDGARDYVGFVRANGIPYMQGSAYWLSARAMHHIVDSTVMRPGVIDDGATGMALVDKVPFVHDYRYHPGPKPLAPVPAKNNVITCHKCLPLDMHQIHSNWLLAGGQQ